MDIKGKKVYVGLSGGVDSAVSAYLLKSKGALVTGVFIKGWYPETLVCSWKEDRADAMRVAAYLEIPFITFDAAAVYKKSVLEYMIKEYREGSTPNPDIMCNKDVKFGAFYDFAMKDGADYIATGHYARISGEGDSICLGKHTDASKDQSYFLWAIPKKVLPQTIFPLADIHKTTTRSIAAAKGLPVMHKKDSQGICFLGSVTLDEFLQSEIPQRNGSAVTKDGVVVGEHNGVLLYTIGERVPLLGNQPGPWFVLEKHISDNVLVVGNKIPESSPETSYTLHDTNFFKRPNPTDTIEAQYRYHGPRITGRLTEKNTFLILSGGAQVASGQSLVLYRGEECLGGGILR